MGSLAPARRCGEFEESSGERERDFGLGVKGPERNIRGTNKVRVSEGRRRNPVGQDLWVSHSCVDKEEA